MMEFHSHLHTQHKTKITTTSNRTANTSHVSPWFSPLAYFLGHNLVLPLFFRQIRITGQENLCASEPVILAPTHRSRWDALLIPYAAGRYVTGKDLRFMVTMNECQGLQGWFVRHMGGFPVNPKRPSIGTLRHGVDLLQQRESLVIFPEGGIFRDGKVHPLKAGIARLALTAESSHPGLGVKIIPIGINYNQQYPQWGADVKINIGTPISAMDYLNGCVKQDAKNLTEDLGKALQKLNGNPLVISSRPALVQMSNS
ncbi:MAG: 1-acyl-sn-glycerol-3-phosphate acyltransferase [Calothrix sp. MO_167.B42]|nr:1-acyl-sn-glycerol-3-phosphate acyltransferase [Calothrix sp. MO_167.B42]